ncbi:aspartate aminotransferase family protein [Bosea sp. F3-2]|uniref:aspartate aminotransferase family protein n=1 Tax=Bosea sp. F3-2 TaxID=2599640 RepID=UPI0011F01B24|nr:aspartate aminotransferase family protein [Bosea sp. F3-2]QEL22842.1 aspartate aminotransferase family protein [Bosea sp. F3-2]
MSDSAKSRASETSSNYRDNSLEAALSAARRAFAEANPKSRDHNQMAATVLPGGNTRTVIYTPPFPLTIAKGENAYLWDIDGHRYVDFLGEYTAGLFGHSHPVLRKAIARGVERGLSLGGHNTDEAELARLIVQRFKSIELVRFTNSGTEANMMAITAAVGFTGRTKLVVFEGAYHGSVLRYPAGDKLSSNAPYDTEILPYNDVGTLERYFAEHPGQVAGALIEPMMGSAGCVPATPQFLQAVRDVTRRDGALLIFDEVQTSRLAPGGLQSVHGIDPDLTTVGKYLAGGVSFGAFGGAKAIMEQFDPRRKGGLSHAGTFNNNSITMSCGVAVLSELFDDRACAELNQRGDRLRKRINGLAAEHRVRMTASGLGSIMNIHFVDGPISDAWQAKRSSSDLRELLWLHMVQSGFWIAQRGMMSLSVLIEDEHVDGIAEAIRGFIQRYGHLFAR